jgi:uncharacterized protein with HXXEE motif
VNRQAPALPFGLLTRHGPLDNSSDTADSEAAMSKDWFEHNWMNAGFITGLFLLTLVPLLVGVWSLPLLLVYLHGPVYMLHQLEEHYDDRFRRFVNDHLAGGLPALTTPAVVFVNVPGVWGVNLVALYLARFVDLGLGLIAVYLVLVNAVAHIVSAVVLRGYNPGLVTAIVLFFPLGLCTLYAMAGVTMTDHAIGLGVAVAIHAAIMLHVKQRVRALEAAA